MRMDAGVSRRIRSVVATKLPAMKGCCPVNDFVGDHAEREHVGAPVGRLLEENLGRHVGRSSGEGAGAIDGGTLIGARQVLGDAEVQNLHLALAGEHYVFRLDVTVNDAPLVR